MRKVTMQIESWATSEPFSITGHTFTEIQVLVVKLEQQGKTGFGEASGVYYLNETGDSMLTEAATLKGALEQGLDRRALQQSLPPGGARNAIDCALWDLEAKLLGKTVWELTGLSPASVLTVNTVGIDTPAVMAEKAINLDSPLLKVKLDGEQPLACIKAVREARPEAALVVDVNQGWNFEQLVDLAPKFKSLGITMIEQPLARGADHMLEGYKAPLPLCADESCLDTTELQQASQRYQMINIKLDKTGGLTEALKLARQAIELNLGVMVGNMLGTSLGMAPAFVLAQYCQLSDIDGPLLLKSDRQYGLEYTKGLVDIPDLRLWG